MLGFAPISSRPISALPDNSLSRVTIVATAALEARLNNPLADLVTDPRKRLVLAVEIVAVPIGA